jgi:hypothetical protein
MTPASQDSSIWAEGERVHDSAVSLPDAVKRSASLFPDTHLPLQAARSLPPPRRRYSYNPSGIDSFGQDRVADQSKSERGIVHLNALEVGPTNAEM